MPDIIITRSNCALDRRTNLFLYGNGFQRQVLKHDPKCKRTPLTKFPWIPRIIIQKIRFVGTLVLLRIPQRVNIGIFFPDSAYKLRILLSGFYVQFADSTGSCGFHLFLRNPEQLPNFTAA